jgi:hypothetical protein
VDEARRADSGTREITAGACLLVGAVAVSTTTRGERRVARTSIHAKNEINEKNQKFKKIN